MDHPKKLSFANQGDVQGEKARTSSDMVSSEVAGHMVLLTLQMSPLVVEPVRALGLGMPQEPIPTRTVIARIYMDQVHLKRSELSADVRNFSTPLSAVLYVTFNR